MCSGSSAATSAGVMPYQPEGTVCVWLKPVLVAQVEFLEWTGENHLRHSKFVALREDKPARDVRRE